MIHSVIIFRVNDALPLCATMEDQEIERTYPEYKTKAKQIIKTLGEENIGENGSIEAGDFVFHYSVRKKEKSLVCFFLINEKKITKQISHVFLYKLEKEFWSMFEQEKIHTIIRPYALIKFDSVIEKLFKEHENEISSSNISLIEKELGDVSQIVNKSIKEFLERGERINKMGELSEKLIVESKKYAKTTYTLNLKMTLQEYLPIVIALFFFCVFIYFYFKGKFF